MQSGRRKRTSPLFPASPSPKVPHIAAHTRTENNANSQGYQSRRERRALRRCIQAFCAELRRWSRSISSNWTAASNKNKRSWEKTTDSKIRLSWWVERRKGLKSEQGAFGLYGWMIKLIDLQIIGSLVLICYVIPGVVSSSPDFGQGRSITIRRREYLIVPLLHYLWCL